MEVARRQHDLRIEADQSPVAFSDPCAAGRKRRCLFPSSFSPRKKMLVELPPFSAPVLSPPASAGAFSSALSPSSGSNRGFTVRASTESNRSGSLALLASLERPPTPMGSTAASSGFGVSSRPPFSPGTGGARGTRASAFLASPPNPACTGLSGGNDGGELAFLASPKSAGSSGSSAVAKVLSPAGAGPGIGSGGDLVVSPPLPLVLAPPLLTPASPVRTAEGSTLWSRRRGNKRQREEKPQIALPPKKVANTGASAASDREPSPGAILSVSSSTRPCCTFVSSPAKATKEEANRRDVLTALRSSSTAGTCCTFVTSPTRPSAVDKASGPLQCEIGRRRRLAAADGCRRAGGGERDILVRCTKGVLLRPLSLTSSSVHPSPPLMTSSMGLGAWIAPNFPALLSSLNIA